MVQYPCRWFADVDEAGSAEGAICSGRGLTVSIEALAQVAARAVWETMDGTVGASVVVTGSDAGGRRGLHVHADVLVHSAEEAVEFCGALVAAMRPHGMAVDMDVYRPGGGGGLRMHSSNKVTHGVDMGRPYRVLVHGSLDSDSLSVLEALVATRLAP